MTQFVGGPPEPASPWPSPPANAAGSPTAGSPTAGSPAVSSPAYGTAAYRTTAGGPTPPASRPDKASYPVTGLCLAGVAVAGIGSTSYALLATIQISAFHPFGATPWWILGFIVASGLGLAGLIIGIVALAKGRRRILASITLALMILAAPLALVAGLTAGTGSLYTHAMDKLSDSVGPAKESLSQTLKDQGVEVSPLLEWLLD